MLAYATDATDPRFAYFLVINNTKMPLLGGKNQTILFGFSDYKMTTTTMSFLNSIPDGPWIPFDKV